MEGHWLVKTLVCHCNDHKQYIISFRDNRNLNLSKVDVTDSWNSLNYQIQIWNIIWDLKWIFWDTIKFKRAIWILNKKTVQKFECICSKAFINKIQNSISKEYFHLDRKMKYLFIFFLFFVWGEGGVLPFHVSYIGVFRVWNSIGHVEMSHLYVCTFMTLWFIIVKTVQ